MYHYCKCIHLLYLLLHCINTTAKIKCVVLHLWVSHWIQWKYFTTYFWKHQAVLFQCTHLIREIILVCVTALTKRHVKFAVSHMKITFSSSFHMFTFETILWNWVHINYSHVRIKTCFHLTCKLQFHVKIKCCTCGIASSHENQSHENQICRFTWKKMPYVKISLSYVKLQIHIWG
jgi:hypothetical protein